MKFICAAIAWSVAISLDLIPSTQAAHASAITAQLPRENRVPGGVAVIPVGDASAAQPAVTANGAKVWVTQRGKEWVAVVGVPLAAAPGDHAIEITRSGDQQTASYRVKPKQYPVQRLKLDRKMVDPPAELTERLARESAHLAAVRKTWTASPSTSARFVIPADGRLSSRFGVARVLNGKPRAPHAGLDVAVPTGTPIVAPADGVVLDVGDYYYCGKAVFLDHGNGLITMYCHLSDVVAKVGDVVKQGQRIALSGGTGRATGPHLHWTVFLNGVAVEPELFIAVKKQPV